MAGPTSIDRCAFVAQAGEHTIAVRVPAGFSVLDVATRPGPGTLPDGRPARVYMSGWSIEPAPDADACTTATPASPARIARLGNASG